MKKDRKPPHHHSNKTRSEANNSQHKALYGRFESKNGKNYIHLPNGPLPIDLISTDIKTPIPTNAKVKVISMKPEAGRREIIKLIKVYDDMPSVSKMVEEFLEQNKVRMEFSPAVIKEAEKLGTKVSPADMKNRLDLSGYAFCTIDGETAKDFDDAVYAEHKGKSIEVMVAIADVSHYVPANSALDNEAYERGTSIYYPGSCIPMLPESISNGLCSLKPDVYRLAMAVMFEVGPKGGITNPRIKPSFIKSQARLTYNQVQAYYDDPKSLKISKELADSLELLRKAAHILRNARKRRGAIDFDLVESLVALDDVGEPLSIHPQDRLDTHKIIEDLMVATNEIVAEVLEKREIPSLYRVHEAPSQEKLENFFQAANGFGVLQGQAKTKASSITEPKDLQEVMAVYDKSPYRDTLNTLMLRAMMQARYSEQNLMHFGLASTAYSHFTSPIRRYADLAVHRQLRTVVFEKKYREQTSDDEMAKIAAHISDREVKATDLERKIHRYYAAGFMSKKVGEVFDAVVVACTEFGFFVRVTEFHVEGLVHIATISSSHVVFMPEKMMLVISGSNRKFMVGDKVQVKLINVNIQRGLIDFELHPKEERAANAGYDRHDSRGQERSFDKRPRPGQNKRHESRGQQDRSTRPALEKSHDGKGQHVRASRPEQDQRHERKGQQDRSTRPAHEKSHDGKGQHVRASRPEQDQRHERKGQQDRPIRPAHEKSHDGKGQHVRASRPEQDQRHERKGQPDRPARPQQDKKRDGNAQQDRPKQPTRSKAPARKEEPSRPALPGAPKKRGVELKTSHHKPTRAPKKRVPPK
jgi:ribonuclease R